MEIKENYFEKLNNISVKEKTEKRSLTYLSWAWGVKRFTQIQIQFMRMQNWN